MFLARLGMLGTRCRILFSGTAILSGILINLITISLMGHN